MPPRKARMTNMINELNGIPLFTHLFSSGEAALHKIAKRFYKDIQKIDFTVNHKFEQHSECP